MAWVLDLDGVVWLASAPIAGAREAVARLRDHGEKVAFVTNNSSLTLADVRRKLARHGIPCTAEDVITSAEAAASLVQPDERVLVLGGDGVFEALARRGIQADAAGAPTAASYDVVVVGWHRQFDFESLAAGVRAVLAGARLVGTNSDATYPTPGGLLPGAGSILAAVAFAAGVEPEVAGKPSPIMARLLLQRLGSVPEVVVGDRLDTDGALAALLGCPFALVLSGVTDQAPPGVLSAPDLGALVTQYPLKL